MTKPPIWFWIISGLALSRYLIGICNYVIEYAMSDTEKVGHYGVEQATLIINQPSWYSAAFACAVFGGASGTLGLLLRRTWAFWLLLVSLIGIFFQNVFFGLSNFYATIHGFQWGMVILIPLVAVYLVWFSCEKIANGTLQR